MESLAALHARGHVADDVAQALLPFRIALIVKGGQGLDQRDAGLDHGGKLSGKENEIGFFDRPGFFARFGRGGFLLERKHHQPTTHQAGNGVVFVESVLNAGNDLPGHISGLVGEGDHVMVIIFRIAATVPPLSLPAP